jgi:hypothetical protein
VAYNLNGNNTYVRKNNEHVSNCVSIEDDDADDNSNNETNNSNPVHCLSQNFNNHFTIKLKSSSPKKIEKIIKSLKYIWI